MSQNEPYMYVFVILVDKKLYVTLSDVAYIMALTSVCCLKKNISQSLLSGTMSYGSLKFSLNLRRHPTMIRPVVHQTLPTKGEFDTIRGKRKVIKTMVIS